jgi:UDPglucose 6-dehydrogenase
MKIAVVGAGYVGLPTSIGFAELGHDVTCIECQQNKVEALRRGEITIYEDGLEDLFQKNLKSGGVKFTTKMQEGISDADLVILAVATPPHPVTKEADMKYIHAAATELAEYLNGYTIVATKSTVPVGTGDDVEDLINQANSDADCDVVSMPEFLREGFAVHDFFNPDRVVIGTNSEKAANILNDLYEPFKAKSQVLTVGRRSAELIKYASNAFLSVKLHYINEIADLCEKTGADIDDVAKGIGSDSRIGNKFLNPGPGYGGSCFPKDTNALSYIGRINDIDLSIINSTIKGNDQRTINMVDRITDKIADIKTDKIAVLGLAFKGGTDDCRNSPALDIVSELVRRGADITAYDPKAMSNAKELIGDKISYANDMHSVADGADVLVILTEWEEFRDLDLDKIKSLLKAPKIVDLRNILDYKTVKASGIEYSSIGRR